MCVLALLERRDGYAYDIASRLAEAIGMAAGGSEADIAAALGDPMRLARELRAEAGFRRWETERTPASFFAVLFGFLALVAVDFVFLLPLLGGLALFTLIAAIVLLALCVAGIALLAKLFSWNGLFAVHSLAQRLHRPPRLRVGPRRATPPPLLLP